MANEIKINTVYGLLGIYILTKPMYVVPYGDYHIDLDTLSEFTGLTKYEVIQKYPVVWQRDNTAL